MKNKNNYINFYDLKKEINPDFSPFEENIEIYNLTQQNISEEGSVQK